MLVIDTSALMAIIFVESLAVACELALESEETLVISAGTLAEALIVAGRRNRAEEMERLIADVRCYMSATISRIRM